MTTLVGIQLENSVVMAADSQVTEDNLRTISTSTPKIIHVGKYLLGIAGDTRPGDILTYNWKPPFYKNEDPVQFMGKKVIPSILESFRENQYDPFDATKDKDAGFDYLVAFDGNLFHIACDMSFLTSIDGIHCIGSGGQFAYGYLYDKALSLTPRNASKYARRAVEIATVLDINSYPPIQLEVQERG